MDCWSMVDDDNKWQQTTNNKKALVSSCLSSFQMKVAYFFFFFHFTSTKMLFTETILVNIGLAIAFPGRSVCPIMHVLLSAH